MDWDWGPCPTASDDYIALFKILLANELSFHCVTTTIDSHQPHGHPLLFVYLSPSVQCSCNATGGPVFVEINYVMAVNSTHALE